MDRGSALAQSDIIITGVPDSGFELVKPEEVSNDAVCINFSSEKNFADGIESYVRNVCSPCRPNDRSHVYAQHHSTV